MRVPDVGTPKSKLPPIREGRRRSKQRKNLRSRGKMTGGLRVAPLVSGSPPAARRQPLPTESLGKGLCVFGLCKAEHHVVAVIATQGTRERIR
jgi:hypothetical protein